MPFNRGGPTTRQNLALTCRRHNHTKKTGTGWSYHQNFNGTFTWTTDTGHRYTSPTTQTWPHGPPF